jgi:hypothetical protein
MAAWLTLNPATRLYHLLPPSLRILKFSPGRKVASQRALGCRARSALPFTASAIDADAADFRSALFLKAFRARPSRFLRRPE